MRGSTCSRFAGILARRFRLYGEAPTFTIRGNAKVSCIRQTPDMNRCHPLGPDFLTLWTTKMSLRRFVGPWIGTCWPTIRTLELVLY